MDLVTNRKSYPVDRTSNRTMDFEISSSAPDFGREPISWVRKFAIPTQSQTYHAATAGRAGQSGHYKNGKGTHEHV